MPRAIVYIGQIVYISLLRTKTQERGSISVTSPAPLVTRGSTRSSFRGITNLVIAKIIIFSRFGKVVCDGFT